MADNPTISSASTTSPQPGTLDAGTFTVTGGGNPLGSVDDLLGQLQEMSWGGVSFPAEETDFELVQDLVVHKFIDRNGAFVEGIGRHPARFTAQIPFLNQIYSAPQESWPQGALYPYQWRLFLAQCLDGISKRFVHPELGPLNCKLERMRTVWKGSVRGGVIVSATWIESDDTQANQLGQALSSASPIGLLEATADDLDQEIATLQAAVSAQQNPLPGFESTFGDIVVALLGVAENTTLLAKDFGGQVANAINAAEDVVDALSSGDVILGPLDWPIFQNCQRIEDGAYDIQALPTIANRPIGVAELPKAATLPEAALYVGADITDFITLNYPLVSLQVIPRGAKVQYYLDAA